MEFMTQGTRAFGDQGKTDPGRRWEQPPAGPDLDLSWHEEAACATSEEAALAMEDIQKEGQRPWEEWCFECPVKAKCLLQGLAEDALQPPRGKKHEKYSPFIYGGFSPRERRVLSPAQKRWHAARLREEDEWLREGRDDQAA